MNRWEWLEGLQKETPARVATRELSKLLVTELRNGPPAVEWSDTSHRERFSALYEPGAWNPSETAVREAVQRLQWELTRNFDAISHYERNHLLHERCPGANEYLSSDFLHFYLYEAFLQLIETTENRIQRRDILDCLSELESWLLWGEPE